MRHTLTPERFPVRLVPVRALAAIRREAPPDPPVLEAGVWR
jgi:hypothetical protein